VDAILIRKGVILEIGMLIFFGLMAGMLLAIKEFNTDD
jgi:hypothetical protein